MDDKIKMLLSGLAGALAVWLYMRRRAATSPAAPEPVADAAPEAWGGNLYTTPTFAGLDLVIPAELSRAYYPLYGFVGFRGASF